jgi:hypothetical protein
VLGVQVQRSVQTAIDAQLGDILEVRDCIRDLNVIYLVAPKHQATQLGALLRGDVANLKEVDGGYVTDETINTCLTGKAMVVMGLTVDIAPDVEILEFRQVPKNAALDLSPKDTLASDTPLVEVNFK